MARLTVRLLGSFQVYLDGVEVVHFASNKERALLAYLVAETDRDHSRRTLAGLLWPDVSEYRAHASLRQALTSLRKLIGNHTANPSFILINHQTVQFNSNSDVSCDLLTFTLALKELAGSLTYSSSLETAVDLFLGDFLEGFFVSGSAPFEEWVLLTRECLKRQQLAALAILSDHYHARGELEKALHYAQRQVELEPALEEAWQQVMRLLALSGRRGEALIQYAACRRALERELEVEPAAETTALYEQIRRGSLAGSIPFATEDLHTVPEPKLPPPPTIPFGQSQSSHTPWLPGRWIAFRLGLLAVTLLVICYWTIANSRALEPLRLTSPITAHTPQPVTFAPRRAKVAAVCESAPQPEICIYHLDTGWQGQITNTGDYLGLLGLSWSPDSRQIVFAVLKEGDAQPNLYLIDEDGSNEQPLAGVQFPGSFPAWSPNGEWIAFKRDNDLWLVRPDGSEVRQLFNGPAINFTLMEINWTRNSDELVFLAYIATAEGGTTDVRAITVKSGVVRWIWTFEGRVSGSIGWSPDGQRLACLCYFSGKQERAVLLSADGSGEIELDGHLPNHWFTHYWPQWVKGD